MWFKVLGPINGIQPIAVGQGVRETARLRKLYGGARWRKLKGFALIELPNGQKRPAELHWYEAHGVGRREMKIKRLLR